MGNMADKPEHPGAVWRWKLFWGFTIFVGLILLGKYAGLMLFHPPRTANYQPALVERGPILDDQGRILAVSTKLQAATVWLPDMKDKQKTAQLLASILTLNPEDLLKKFTTGPNFQYIKRPVSVMEAQAIKAAKANGDLQGVELDPEFGRIYPQKDIAAQVLGYVGLDNIGLAGIEYSYNDLLSPHLTDNERGIVHGNAVWLTLDTVLQYEAQKLADASRIANKAKRVNILVMDPKTGDFKVMASSPSFDPNHFADYSAVERANPLIARAYEPGSVFKLFSISSFLDSGVLTPQMKFVCDGVYERRLPYGGVIRITDLGNYGVLDAQGILTYSSNVGTAQASDLMQEAPFAQYIHAWGFGSPTGLTLPGETPGLLRPRSEWSASSKDYISMGQEIGVSTVQMITAAAGLANNGLLLKPHVVEKVVSPSGEVLYQARREPLRQVVKPEIAQEMLQMTKSTVEYGTAHRARIDGIELAGKTGTAQEYNPKTGTYSNTDYTCSTMLFLPADHPRYVIYVTIDDPLGPSYLGGVIASPLAKQMAERLIRLEGIPKEGETVVDQSSSVRLPPPPVLTVGQTMPDLKGLAKRTLLPLLDQPGLQVTIHGDGWVVQQEPAPGTPLTPDTKVVLDLK